MTALTSTYRALQTCARAHQTYLFTFGKVACNPFSCYMCSTDRKMASAVNCNDNTYILVSLHLHNIT